MKKFNYYVKFSVLSILISIFILSGISYADTLDEMVKKVAFCESSLNHDSWGDLDYKYPSYGYLQFQERTFNFLAKKAGKKGLEWKNKKDQIWLFKWTIKNEPQYLNYWTCYRKIYGK